MSALIEKVESQKRRPPWQRKHTAYIMGPRVDNIALFVHIGESPELSNMFFIDGALKSYHFLKNWQLSSILAALRAGRIYSAAKYHANLTAQKETSNG